MGVHNLVTGLNGHGKTLYVVATKLRPLADATVIYKGREIPRRLVNGGIPQLLLDHELMEVPTIDPEVFADEWATVVRAPGDPAVKFVRRVVVNPKSQAMGWVVCAPEDDGAEPNLCTALNWWTWCEPGDVIVIDECQRLFRPMASGRRVPMFIAQLEVARHYGVEFIYMTQHPQLLHVNVRNLVGPHEDVRRVFGSARCMVYQWDKVSNPDRIGKATGRLWKHDKTAFGLYKSSELHNKFGQRLPLAVWVLVPALVGLAVAAWVVSSRVSDRTKGTVTATPAAVAPSPAAQAASGAPAEAARPSQVFPALDVRPVVLDREPYAGRGLQIEGGYLLDGKPFAIFGLIQDGQRIATVTLAELVRAGYAYTAVAPCSGLLRFRDQERVLSCGPRGVASDRSSPSGPALAASGAVSA